MDSKFSKPEESFYRGAVYAKMISIPNKASLLIISLARLRLAVALLTRTAVPMILRIYYIYLRHQESLYNKLRNNLLPSILTLLRRGILVKSKKIYNSSCIDELYPERSVDCQVLFSPKEEILGDVIFIHGLHGGVNKTWRQGEWRHKKLPRRNSLVNSRKHSLKKTSSIVCTKSDEDEWEVIEDEYILDDEGYSNCWPQDWLPKDCPGTRVIALNYTTDILWCPVWKKGRKRSDMVERSDEMIEELVRLGVGRKPIIWVGHSKGGLFIKQIILNAWERHFDRPEIYNIFENSKGIMFYSVPHKGSFLADVALPLLRRSVEVIEIQRNCDFVLEQHKKFLEICQRGHFKAEIFSFIETSFTFMSFIYVKIVSYDSADPDIGEKYDVPLDHREICKPAGRDCFLYQKLVNLIRKKIENT